MSENKNEELLKEENNIECNQQEIDDKNDCCEKKDECCSGEKKRIA